jgi:hypothetical protein
MPVDSLDCYGLVEDAISESRRAWLFLEDAGDAKLTSVQQDRELVASWLARAHAWAPRTSAASTLDLRSGEYYLAVVRDALGCVESALANPDASAAISESLATLARNCRSMLASWDHIAHILDTIPPTLVHGGLASKNVRVREAAHRPVAFLFDWEAGGWGYPITDVSRADMEVYARTYEIEAGREISRARLREYQRFGSVLWSLAAIPGEAESLGAPWVDGLEGKIGFYAQQVEAAIGEPIGLRADL